MKNKLISALLGMGMTLILSAEEPILWLSDFNFGKPGEISSSITGKRPIRTEGGRNFVSTEGRIFGLLQGVPRGDSFGDVRFTFSAHPRSDQFSMEISLHQLTGGSRRFRRDMLFNIKVLIDSRKIAVIPNYVRDKPYEKIRHMTSAPRDHGEGLEPFPEIKAQTYDLSGKFQWETGKWQSIQIVMDQYDLLISINGKQLVQHAINPGAGVISMNSFGPIDYADFEIREIRPAYDPYLEENLLTEQKNPLRSKPLDKLPEPKPKKAESKKPQRKWNPATKLPEKPFVK